MWTCVILIAILVLLFFKKIKIQKDIPFEIFLMKNTFLM